MDHFQRPDDLPPVNGYSHAVSFSGTVLAVSGQLPLDGEGHLVGADDPLEQARQVFRNLGTALAAGGSSLATVVKLTVYLTDLADLGAFRTARNEVIDTATPPASTVVQVKGLLVPGARLEIEALALVRR